MKVQIPFRLSEKTAAKIRADAAGIGVTLDDYAEKAFQEFHRYPRLVRRTMFRRRKVFGPKIKHVSAQ